LLVFGKWVKTPSSRPTELFLFFSLGSPKFEKQGPDKKRLNSVSGTRDEVLPYRHPTFQVPMYPDDDDKPRDSLLSAVAGF
jgi:hypothetical protein